MGMTQGHYDNFHALEEAGNTLDDKVAAYNVAKIASVVAETNLTNAKTALDTAVVNFNTKNTMYDTAMLTFPAGYVPPA